MSPTAPLQALLTELLGPVQGLLRDPTVSELMINGADVVYVERAGRIEPTDVAFEGEHGLYALLTAVAQLCGKPFGPEHPILEGHLPDGSRIQAVARPVAPDGPVVCIRRFARACFSLEALARQGSIHPVAMTVLRERVAERCNLIVAGGTGSGKTSLLNALSALVPSTERVALIEDVPELQLEAHHVVALETRPADARGRGAVTTRDLFRACLRLRPDRIVIGEIRGAEALELIQAMTSGHRGCLSTLHASHPNDALARLETMALMSELALPLAALRQQIGSAVDVLVQTDRLPDGRRVVSHVVDVLSGDAGGYVTRTLYERSPAQPPPALAASHFRLEDP